ncbi:MAG: 5-(carboxyamino)imidazole ribonucleotide synthase [Verrucomicrobiota bacterium]
MKPILPGSTIGLLGGGQLGRMFAIAARKMGYRVHTFEPVQDSPTGQISDREFNSRYDDTDALLEFARDVQVVTYEFENIPIETLDELSNHVVLRPNRELLYVCQNRRREKEFLAKHGFPLPPFRVVESEEELRQAVEELGCPCVLKTADFGYDGKGQQKITSPDQVAEVWAQHQLPAGVLESWVDYEAEVSVIVGRGYDGETRFFPMARNEHENHILAVSEAPCGLPDEIEAKGQEIAEEIARSSHLVGVLAVEMFLTRGGELLVNELAPRPHNSGHYSFDACLCSQFEQQLRAVCGLPLGDTRLLSPVLMHNLLGDVWLDGNPDWASLLKLPGLKLHIYGKSEPRHGRKMGHYCILGASSDKVRQIDAEAQLLLQNRK